MRSFLAAAVAAVCATAVACQQQAEPPSGGSPARRGRPELRTAPSVPAWLNSSGQPQSAVRMTTERGVELSQAVFNSQGILCLLRDYTQRTPDAPDKAWLMYAGPGEQPVRGETVAIPGAALPARLFTSPDRSQTAVLGWAPNPVPAPVPGSTSSDEIAEAATAEPLPEPDGLEFDLQAPQLFLVAAASPAVRIEAVPQVGRSVPVAFGADGAIYFRPLGSAKVDAGLIDYRLDWTAPALVWKPGMSQVPQPVEDPALLAAPGGAQAAGLQVLAAAGEAQPAWEIYLWRAGRGLKSRLLCSPAVVAGAMPDDQLSLCWLNAQRLVLSAPEPIGFDRSNWRLISVSTLKGEMTLIADALPPGVPAVAMDEVVFYCRPAGGDTTWELWASSADGLRKRLIYAARNTETLSIMDASSGRLLLNRRYLAEGSGALRSGLIELALTPLVAWRIGSSKLEAPGDEGAIDFTSPDSPKPGSDADAGSPGFIPDSKGDGAAGDAADRYRRRGKGGGGTAPPDLSLPGL